MRAFRTLPLLLCLLMCAAAAHTQTQTERRGPTAPSSIPEKTIMHHAHGTFDVQVTPVQPPNIEGIARYSINKTVHGDLEAITRGEMYAAGDQKKGSAGYVAMEIVTGKLDGKSGSFVLQHMASMDGGAPEINVKVVPGSGTGELAGIKGTFTIRIVDGKHFYDLDYTLPE